LKIKLTVVCILASCIIYGCGPRIDTTKQLEEGKELFTVDFNEGQVLRYKFVSKRDIVYTLGSMANKPNDKAEDEFIESLELVMAYKPIEVDQYGITVIEAKCESVKPQRNTPENKRLRNSKDPVQILRGRSFTFTVLPTGEIADYSELDSLIKEMGEKAFTRHSSQGRIKNPDMISDFIASQWFLWDSISSIEDPLKGVGPGDRWTSLLSVPSPLVLRKARDVKYNLTAIRKSQDKRLALIRSSYSLAKEVPSDWPVPYSGSFGVKGRFGFLRSLRVEKLEGKGEELFDIDSGRMEKYTQKYHMEVAASLMFPLPGTLPPRVTIDQELTMELLGAKNDISK
jgi:hypothetical protein